MVGLFRLRWYHFYWGALVGMVVFVWAIAFSLESTKASSSALAEKLEFANTEEEIERAIGFPGELVSENVETGEVTKEWGKRGDALYVRAIWKKHELQKKTIVWGERPSMREIIKGLLGGQGRQAFSPRGQEIEKVRLPKAE